MRKADEMRKRLLDMANGGSGDVERVITRLPQPDDKGNEYYIILNGVKCFTKTQQQAEKLRDIDKLGV